MDLLAKVLDSFVTFILSIQYIDTVFYMKWSLLVLGLEWFLPTTENSHFTGSTSEECGFNPYPDEGISL